MGEEVRSGMRRFAIGLLASSLLTLFTGAQTSNLGARMERVLAAPSPESTSRARRLSSDDVVDGLKSMLTDGASIAVIKLGARHGFGAPDGYRLPPLAATGGGTHAYERLCRAAESTASQAGPILREAINDLHFPAPEVVLNGSPTAATQFLRDHAGEHIRAELVPVVSRSYRATLASLDDETPVIALHAESRIADHLAQATTEAFLHVIAEQETLIRNSTAARSTPQLINVFGRTV
ncbi:DUF4197 family protein [Salinisphaera hydrothermalis]|uniref:DUF4197 family protein n=1 Tax=Salinisphaera hydrothermalis TaxID=563188 RepID=UPI0033403E6B